MSFNAYARDSAAGSSNASSATLEVYYQITRVEICNAIPLGQTDAPSGMALQPTGNLQFKQRGLHQRGREA